MGACAERGAAVASFHGSMERQITEMIALAMHVARGGTDGQKERAALDIGDLADGNVRNKHAIGDCGGVELLIALARDGTDGQKKQAAKALGNLADGDSRSQHLIREVYTHACAHERAHKYAQAHANTLCSLCHVAGGWRGCVGFAGKRRDRRAKTVGGEGSGAPCGQQRSEQGSDPRLRRDPGVDRDG